MRVFHCGSDRQADVAADAPVQRSVEEALRLFAGLHDYGSFIGLELDDRHVLQMRCEDSVFRTEILDTQSLTIEYCTLSRPLAEKVIREAYAGGDFRRVPRESFIEWQHDEL